jgi:hypothetical protein
MTGSQWKETDVAAAVVRWLTDDGWDVYQEVALGPGEPILDIVARRGPVLWIVECKAALSLVLLDQAARSIGLAHMIAVAARSSGVDRTRYRHHFTTKALDSLGIGRFVVREVNTGYDGERHCPTYKLEADLVLRPALSRRIVTDFLSRRLNQKQRDYAPAGNAEGRRWSPFQDTCEGVRRYVREHPRCTLKDCMDAVNHHYHTKGSARSSMSHWIRAGKVKGVRAERDGRFLRLELEATT